MLHESEGNYNYIKEDYDENIDNNTHNMKAVEMVPTYENQITEEYYNNNYYQNPNEKKDNNEYENEEEESDEDDINKQLQSKSELVKIPEENNNIEEINSEENINEEPIPRKKQNIPLRESKDSNKQISNSESITSSMNNSKKKENNYFNKYSNNIIPNNNLYYSNNINNNRKNHNYNNYNYNNNFPDHNISDSIQNLYSELLERYNKVCEEKAEVIEQLNKEILENEQQKTYIHVLKSSLDNLIKKTTRNSIINKNNYSTNKELDNNKEKDKNKESDKDNLSYSEILLMIPKLQNEIALYKVKITDLQQKNLEILNSKKEIETQYQSLNNEYNNILKKNNILLNALEKSEKEKEEKIKIVKDQEEKIINLTKNLNELNDIKDKYNILLKDKAITDNENHQLINDINQSKILLEEISNKYEETKTTLSNKENDIKHLDEKLNEKKNENEKLTSSNKELNDLVIEYKVLNEKLNTENLFIKQQKEANEKHFNDSIKDKDTNINSILENISKLKIEKENIITENNKLNEEKNQLNNNLNDLKNEYNIILSTNKSLNNDLNINTKKITELNNQITKNQTEIDLYQNQINSLNQQIEKNNNNYDNTLKNFTDKINSLSLENEKFKLILEKNVLSKNPDKQSSLMHNPKLAIKTCLTASKKLIDTSHNFYKDNYKDYQKFLDSLDELRRELEICYQTISSFDNNEREIVNLNNKYNQVYQEMISYKNDNKKLFDNNIKLFNSHEVLQKERDYLIKSLKEILPVYINSREISEILLKIVYFNRQIIYCKNDLNELNKKIENLKLKIKKDNIDGMNYLEKLQNEKENLEFTIEKYIKCKNQLEYQLNNQQ